VIIDAHRTPDETEIQMILWPGEDEGNRSSIGQRSRFG
jgi:hypothetical protein